MTKANLIAFMTLTAVAAAAWTNSAQAQSLGAGHDLEHPLRQWLLLFEGSAKELREHLGQPVQEPSQP